MTTRHAQGLRELLHDLNHEIAGVRMLAEAAMRQDMSRDPPSRWISLLRTQCDSMTELTRSAFREPVPSDEASVHNVVCQAVAYTQATPGVTVALTTTDTAFAVVSELALRRAVVNLLTNAVRAAAPDGRVTVEVRRTDTEVRIQVDDTGRGFGPPVGAASTSSVGLPIAHRIAEQAGGRLEVGASPLGGAQVALVLPLAPGFAAGSPVASELDSPTRR